MKLSERLRKMPPYLFAEIDRVIEEKRRQGVDIISFGVGDPDMPTPGGIVRKLAAEAAVPENQRYPSYFGLPAFREAVSTWFAGRFGVELDPGREILPLIGSKEGIAHFSLAVLDPGDVAIVPEPSYPVYEMGALIAGAEVHNVPLRKENSFLPDLEGLPAEIRERAKLMWLNYPNNPTSAVADVYFFEKTAEFAEENDIIIAHDNAYSEITFDGFVAPSLLQVDAARERSIEFHSLSKSFNMTGFRIGFACGSAKLIEALGVIKTNIDSGVFNPVQLAAAHALLHEKETIERMRKIYSLRRDLVTGALASLGWNAPTPLGSIYVWMEVPEGFDSAGFSKYILEKTGVFFTPGNAYGPSGDGYVRISLTVPDERIMEALSRLEGVFS